MQAINNEAKASYDTAASLLTDGQYDQIVPKRGQSIAQKPTSHYVELAGLFPH